MEKEISDFLKKHLLVDFFLTILLIVNLYQFLYANITINNFYSSLGILMFFLFRNLIIFVILVRSFYKKELRKGFLYGIYFVVLSVICYLALYLTFLQLGVP